MYLLIASLVSLSGQAHAGDLIVSPICHLPCLSVGIGAGGTIIPSDWLELEERSLGGNMNWFRVEVSVDGDLRAVTIGGTELSERNYSREESNELTSVYYVPVEKENEIAIYTDERSSVYLTIRGAEKAPF